MSGSKDEATEASPGNRHSKDKAVVTEMLNRLQSNDRQALLRFYIDGQPHDEIESALGLDADRFRELRRSFKAAFFKRTGRGR